MNDKQREKRLALIALIAIKQAPEYNYSTGVDSQRVEDYAKQWLED